MVASAALLSASHPPLQVLINLRLKTQDLVQTKRIGRTLRTLGDLDGGFSRLSLGRKGPMPGVFVGALRPTVENTVRISTPFSVHDPMNLDGGLSRLALGIAHPPLQVLA